VAVNVTGSPAHKGPETEGAILTTGDSSGFTSITMSLENASTGFAHAALDVKRTSMVSPSFKVDEVKVVPVCTIAPFTLHRITGAVPPFTVVAVNVTGVPSHIGPAGETVILTEGTAVGVILATITFESAEGGDGQVADDVISTLTISPFVSEEVVNVGVFPPVGFPLISH
jgi:hypothetical protein